jgi:hypothetical protein
MIDSPSVLAAIIEVYFTTHFFQPSASFTNRTMTGRRSVPYSNIMTTPVVPQMFSTSIETEFVYSRWL